MIYDAANQHVLKHVPQTAGRILDVGCGSGALGEQIKQTLSCEVVGITQSECEAGTASKLLDQVVVCDLNNFELNKFGRFDCVICSHVLEHLYQPHELLIRMHNNLNPNAVLIVALPNILYWKQRLEFIKGKFQYADGGLVDKTHFRFFDIVSARALLEETGYSILTFEAHGNFPLPAVRNLLPLASLKIDHFLLRKFPGLFAFEFIFICQSRAKS